jgi:hypothetical protein
MEWPPWLANWYAPIDFSNILGCPNELPSIDSDFTLKFYGHNDSTTLHILSFLEFISDLGIIHEHVMTPEALFILLMNVKTLNIQKLPRVINFAYDLHFRRVIARWKSLSKNYTFHFQTLTPSTF